ncbi:MAG: hypothetical protein ACOYNS_11875 [Bacteroidota bacterium]
MTTIAPSAVRMFDAATLEKIAYESVKSVPTKEQNDQYRLGYHVWNYLKEQKGSILEAVKQSNARILVSEKEAVDIIESALKGKIA